MIYRVLRWMARLALHVFFRQIEIEAQENVPSTGPVILAPNHSNALVDPMVVVISTQRCVTITAKSALARNPLLACLMHALGVVTFQRKQDRAQGSKPRPNLQSLERCRKILAAGGTVCIFPEGVSHSDAHLRVFHTGAARIALDFIAKDGNPGRLQIVPIGLLYSEKDRFRSAVWLRFGTPLDPAAWLARHPEGGAVELTQEIRRRVADLTLNYETRRESAILHWAAEIAGTGGEDPPPLGFDTDSVSQWFQLLERLQLGYEALLIQDRSTVESLVRRVRRYRSKLKRLGISPREVFLPMHPGRAALFIVRELELVVVGAPMAFFGIINHWLPYRTVKFFAARRLSTKTTGHRILSTQACSFFHFSIACN